MDENLPLPLINSENHQARNTFGEIEEIEDKVGREFRCFKNFKYDSDAPSDHHYFRNYVNFGMQLVQKRAYRERMEEERNLLDKLIPSSIFVRAYKCRDDLMRAAFIGPPGSDYEHCLFFFDMYFPVNYPSVPPKLHYRSNGIELKPNLRADGRVCLNLNMQETWRNPLQQVWFSSNKKGNWNPEESNVLHVLDAIHELISHPSPKPSPWSFNAIAGLGDEHNTRSFFSVCEKMTRILREPPVGFEYFVKGHFRQRAHPILLKFKENNYDDRIMIELFIQMFTAFEKNGAYCKHHLDFLKSRKQQITPEEHLDYLKKQRIATEEDLDSFKRQKLATYLWKLPTETEQEAFGKFRTY